MANRSYYHYFSLGHFSIYRNWVEAARAEGIDMEMVTFISIFEYYRKRTEIRRHNSIEYVHIYPSPPSFFVDVFSMLFFLIKGLRTDELIVHVRNRRMWIFHVLKQVLGDERVKYSFKIEGDHRAERDYILDTMDDEQKYADYLESTKTVIEEKLPSNLERADGVLVVAESLREALDERYEHIDVKKKASVVPTGADISKMYPDEQLRADYRNRIGAAEDEFVMIYVGSAFYQWQNVDRTIEVFDLLRGALRVSVRLVLLVPEEDHTIVESHLDRLDIDNGYVLRQAPYEQVNGYLNASDIGVVLRDNHPMNVRCGRPTKFSEYLAAGLPVLTTAVLKNTNTVARNNWGVVIDNPTDDDEIVRKCEQFIRLSDTIDRHAIHEFAENTFSTNTYREDYANFLRALSS